MLTGLLQNKIIRAIIFEQIRETDYFTENH